jgi:hypothetical protein
MPRARVLDHHLLSIVEPSFLASWTNGWIFSLYSKQTWRRRNKYSFLVARGGLLSMRLVTWLKRPYPLDVRSEQNYGPYRIIFLGSACDNFEENMTSMQPTR